MHKPKFQKRSLFMLAYIVFALLPIYWMVNMSFKTNNEILAGFTLFPDHFTWDNYKTILTDPAWYSGYINSLIYVAINTVISLMKPLMPGRANEARELARKKAKVIGRALARPPMLGIERVLVRS